MARKNIKLYPFQLNNQEKKLKLFRVKRLSEIETFILSKEEEQDLERKYKEHYDSLDDQERDIEKDALLQHLHSQESRIDISYNKINAFTTIIVAVIPIAITFINREMLISLNLLGKIIFGLVIYATVNLCAWIFQAINVRGYMSSSLKI